MESELAEPTNKMTDDELRQELANNGVTLHHKTGSKKLAATLKDVRAGKYENVIPEEEAVIVDDKGEPIGTRIFGPVTRELRLKKYAASRK